MAYRHLLWDFDGTLADTLPSLLEIYNDMANRHGFERIDDPSRVRALTPKAFIQQQRIPLLRVPALIREVLGRHREVIGDVPLVDRVGPVLQSLHERGVTMGIVSSNREENIRLCLAANGVEGLFDFVVGFSRLFGKERAIRKVMKRQGIAPTGTLYVGDEVRDILAAREVGIDVAAVTWGFNTADSLSANQPNFVLERPDELVDLVAA